eukprot:1362505-Pyramimonas_sp.AAC.2
MTLYGMDVTDAEMFAESLPTAECHRDAASLGQPRMLRLGVPTKDLIDRPNGPCQNEASACKPCAYIHTSADNDRG